MVRTILVPLDGSELAEWALPYARTLARTGQGRIILLQATVSALFTDVRLYLEQVAAELRADATVETAVSYRPTVDAVLEETAVQEADLIAMSTHGRSGVGQLVFGSVAREVLVQSPVPVLLVRAADGPPPRDALAGHPRLLVPLDGSAFAEKALAIAEQLAAQLDGELVLLQAVPVPEGPRRDASGHVVATAAQELTSVEREAQDYLGRVRVGLAPPQRDRTRIEVRMGPPAESILAASREHQVSLVVMTTHGRTGVERLLQGSVADQVLHESTLPLLLVR